MMLIPIVALIKAGPIAYITWVNVGCTGAAGVLLLTLRRELAL